MGEGHTQVVDALFSRLDGREFIPGPPLEGSILSDNPASPKKTFDLDEIPTVRALGAVRRLEEKAGGSARLEDMMIPILDQLLPYLVRLPRGTGRVGSGS